MLSGFEVYGTLRETPPEILRQRAAAHKAAVAVAWNDGDLTAYSSDFGPGGVIDFLRIAAGGDLVDYGEELVQVERSSDGFEGGKARDALGTKGVRCFTKNEPNSWWRFDLKRHQVRGDIQRYTLRHGLSNSFGRWTRIPVTSVRTLDQLPAHAQPRSSVSGRWDVGTHHAAERGL